MTHLNKHLACMSREELVILAKTCMEQLSAILDCLTEGMPSETVFDFLMTRKEAAGFIGQMVQSFDRMVREGKLHKVYVNGVPRLRKSELLRHLGYDFDPMGQKSRSELDNIILENGGNLRKG